MFSISSVVATVMAIWLLQYVFIFLDGVLEVKLNNTKTNLILKGTYLLLSFMVMFSLIARVVYMLFNLA